MATHPYKAVQKYPRISIPGFVLVHDEEHFFISPLANVSCGGLFTDQRLSLLKGAEVRVVIKSPQLERPVQALGTVVRIETGKRKGIAIEFTSISRESRERIRTCVAEQKIGRLLQTDH